MAEPRHWHLVMYDVTEDARLRRVHKLLRGWGKPMQYSVFRVRCTAREIERLRFEVTGLLGAEDRLTMVRLCAGCASRVSVRGAPLSPLEVDTPPFRII
ncbi:MAG: CRISPR-associated endonuclease Cas2 [Deltaproteobacteria bacterium]|nr:CRISPR-associated endonuclease Cas2 [Deltaproteobacteria bacterium]